MAKRKADKGKEAEKPRPTRGGLRSGDKKDDENATPDPPEPIGSTNAASQPTKRGTKRSDDDLEDDEKKDDKKVDGKGWRESERKRCEEFLRDAQEAASIAGFEQSLQLLKDSQREGPTKSRTRVVKASDDVNGCGNFNHRTRRKKHDARLAAISHYEYFVYSQTPRRRTQYNEHIDQLNKQKKNPVRADRPAGRLWGTDV